MNEEESISQLTFEEYLLKNGYKDEKYKNSWHWLYEAHNMKTPPKEIHYSKNEIFIKVTEAGVIIQKGYDYRGYDDKKYRSTYVMYSGLVPTVEEFKTLEKLLEL